ncbi:MAG TPA: hypothetical protein VHL57_01865, partial [Flavobacteriales bacterium]|nr:hypothetical protein [Flavobacteriales bacterium]
MAVVPLRSRALMPLLLLGYAIAAALTIVWCDGTGDAGDSISHYFFARYAPKHPTLFFDHWAKPLYVLLACPFAQFGFVGIKVFNAGLSGLSAWLAYRIAQRLGVQHAAVAALLVLCVPLFYVLTFSGLTEPLFAAVLGASVLLMLEDRARWALLVASFLPFVRSEGLLILG